MTPPQFREAARRVSLYGNLLMGVTGSVLIALSSLFVCWDGSLIRGFGTWLRSQFQDEAVVGLVGGFVSGVVLAPLLLIPLVPALWVDRRFGLRCLHCRRSVTLRCRHSQVLQTGRCCLCQRPLFDPPGDGNAAERGVAADRGPHDGSP
jgi:hypothetical protein